MGERMWSSLQKVPTAQADRDDVQVACQVSGDEMRRVGGLELFELASEHGELVRLAAAQYCRTLRDECDCEARGPSGTQPG